MPASNSIFISRAMCIIVCVVAFFATVVATCGPNAFSVLTVLGNDGLYAALWIGGACALGMAILRAFDIRDNALLLISTAGGLGLGIFSLIGLLLGLAGWLNRPVALALPILSVVLLIAMLLRTADAGRPVDLGRLRRWLLQPAAFSWLWLIPVISLAMVCVSASILPGVFWKPFDPAPYDVTSYHLQVPREWYEAGRIVPLAHNVFSYFPFNVEMQFLLLMHVMGGPWAAMYACQFISAGYAALMVLGIAGAPSAGDQDERPTSKGVSLSRVSIFESAPAPVIGAAIASVVPWVLMLGGVAYVESALMLYTTLAVAWGLRAVATSFASTFARSHSRALLLCGVMGGFASGVKITAVPMLLLAVPAAVFAVLMIRRPAAITMRRLSVSCAGCVLAGSVVLSPWLIRNLIWTGNPVWPVAMNTLGRDHFSTDQVERFRKAHSPRDDQQTATAKLAVFWRDVVSHWQFGYLLLPAGLVAIVCRWKDRQTWLLLLTAVIVLVVWIGFTHLLARFLVMLIPIAGILVAGLRWGRLWPAAIAIVIATAACNWANVVPKLMEQTAVRPDHALIGIVDLTGILPPELLEAREKHLHVGLVGDAQAFLFQIPMSHLHYRTVFDIPSHVNDPIEAWLGKQAKGNANYALDINTSEIARLHRTYFEIPDLLDQWKSRLPETFFVRGKGAMPTIDSSKQNPPAIDR